MDEENSILRQKLELLKKDLAKKQKKIEKLDRSRAVKEHVKKKIEEQQSKVEDDVEEVFTQHSAHRGQVEKIQATSKMKTTLVSFNLAKSETIEKETSETNAYSSNDKVCPKSNLRDLQPSTILCSQDDFKETPLLNIQENRKSEIGRRISKKRRSLTTSGNISNVPSAHSKTAVHGKSTEHAVPRELPKSCDSPRSTHMNIKTLSSKHSHLDLNDLSKNSNTAAGSSPSTSLNWYLVLDKPDKTCDSPTVQESQASSSSSVIPRLMPINSNDAPADRNNDHCSPEDKAIIKAEISPGTDMSCRGGKQRRKARRSAANLDFSFLDEEGSGDMYSQIKNRRRRSNRSSQASQAEMFALSQEEYPSSEGSLTKQLMPKIGQGLSQDQTPPPNSRSRQMKESVLPVPNDRHANRPSPLLNSWPMQYDIGPDSLVLSPVPSSLPLSKSSRKSSRKQKMRLSETGILKEMNNFPLPDSDSGHQMEQKVQKSTGTISKDSQLKKGIDTLVSFPGPQFSSQGKRSPQVSGKLMQLPPKSVYKKVSHFFLPDTEYEELKLTKISLNGEDLDINSDALCSERKQNPNTTSTFTHVKSQETAQFEENQKTDDLEVQKAMRKVSSTSKRRRSRKLSPILKVTDDATTSSFSSQETLIYSESPITSQLNDAMISELPPEDEVIQRKLSRATRNSQNSAGRSRKNMKRTIQDHQGSVIETQHSMPSVTSTCGATEQAYVESKVIAENGKSESQNEDMLNMGLLNDSVSYTSTSQASSESDELAPNGQRKIDCVKLQGNRLDIQSIDALSGYMGSDRATIAALAGPKWIQLWCQKERQPWDFVHEWETTNQVVESVQVLTTGDVMAVMTLTTSCVEVFVYASSGRAWNFIVCHRNRLLCCKSSMSLLLAEFTECSSAVIKYKMREDWKCCDVGTVVGDISDCLVSLTTVRGQPGAVIGATTTHAYIWNHNRAALLVQIPLPVNTDICLTSIAEHGLIFMWVSVIGELPCLLVANPNTARCVIAGSLEPSGESGTSLSYMRADTEYVVAMSLDGNLSTWDAVSGGLRTKVGLTETLSCLTLVQNAPSRCVIVTTTGWLHAYSLSV